VKVNLSYTYSLVSDSVGAIYNRINSPGLQSTTEWASFAGLYQEYRVLGIEMKYVPYYNGTFNTTVTPATGAVNVVHTPLTVNPADLDEVINFVTWKPFRTSTSMTCHWKMFGVEEATFSRVADVNSVNHGGIQYFIPGATGETSYGQVFVTYLVEFRARR
jgi:hypothetical protein